MTKRQIIQYLKDEFQYQYKEVQENCSNVCVLIVLDKIISKIEDSENKGSK